MPIKKDNRPVFERCLKEYGIVFRHALPTERWPANHRDVFEAIEKVKRFEYNTYVTAQDNGDDLDRKVEAKSLVRRLTEKARDCQSQNEATWRFACEPLVFSRLTSQLACKNCRKRVWRSEIEAKLNGESSSAQNLRQRQENRDRCRCPRRTRPDDIDERVGLSRLFIDRAEDKVIHPSELRQKLPQHQKPDRVYGLRQTRNFEDLLFKELGNNMFLEDSLHQQPHANTEGEALLFPFLVVEAKAGNAPDDWSSVRLQTAFPIYTYLNTQRSLKSATLQKSKWSSGPLVWFFMSRGEDWRLCLAYQEPSVASQSTVGPTHTTKIVQVWTGCITNPDDALQLFLIVDYMSDWARDVYRPALLTELRILASADADVATVFTDTDIFSSRDILPISNHAEPVIERQSNGHEIQAAFKSLDSHLGTVRHISPIQSNYSSIFITADNVQTFTRSMNINDRTLFVRRMLYQLHSYKPGPSMLSVDQLSAIEELWTGQSRPSAAFNLRETKFYTVHLIVYYISVSWNQVRQLCVISIAEDALDTLLAESKLKIGHGKACKPSIPVDAVLMNRNLMSYLSQLRAASTQWNLLASISRVARYINSTINLGSRRCWFQRSDARIWELVSNTYKSHKKGDLEPELPFLRISESYETQTIDSGARGITDKADPNTSDFDDQGTVDSRYEGSVQPLDRGLQVSKEGAILIHGDLNHPPQERIPSNLGVFIVSGPVEPPSEDDLARIIKNTFEDYDVYHTTRDNGTLNLRNKRIYRDIWNLRNPYGVFFSYGAMSFVKWLSCLDKPLPTRQGSRRGALDSGRSIFLREYTPWHDRRLNYGGPFAEKKRRFLKILFRAEAMSWASIAQTKIHQGTQCCVLCTKDGDYKWTDGDDVKYGELGFIPGLCDFCQGQLDASSDNGFPGWIKKALREGLKQTISEYSATGALGRDYLIGYTIRTPDSDSRGKRMRRFRRFLGVSEDSSDLYTDSSDSHADELPRKVVMSFSNPKILIDGLLQSKDDDGDDDDDDDASPRPESDMSMASSEGDRVTRKRKRRRGEED